MSFSHTNSQNHDDADFEEQSWSSLLLGADYNPSNIEDWVQRRYADVIKLNDHFGYQQVAQVAPLSPSFHGRSRGNVRPQHWSDRKFLSKNNPNYDKLRGKAHAK